jgi:uncharacterized protein YydD (DUF2326 family)
MKLRRIYSSDSRFNTVTFNPQFNVVLGELTNVNDLSHDSHNLGKSTLIYLIDFLLLKDIPKGHFLKSKIFENHVFYLEIMCNSGKYVTIKRASKNCTKISIKIHNQDDLDCRRVVDWDYEELSLGSNKEETNPKSILNRLLGFDVLKDEEYRRTSGYFLRTQDDYNDVFRLQKYRGKDVDWKPVLFELLGFCSEHMINKYIIEYEIATKEQLIESVKAEFKVDSGERDRINGLIEIAQSERNTIIDWLDQFDFYQKEVGLNKEVIEEIEKKVSKLNTERYNLYFEIQQINESLEVKVDYDLKDTLEIYRQVEIYFPEQLVRSYEELLDFNKKVTNERLKYLEKTKIEKASKLEEIDDELKKHNEKRTQLLSVLRGSNTFEKYNSYRSDLIKVEREIERYLSELDSIDNVKGIQKDINELKEKLKNESEKLNQQIEDSTAIYRNIRKDFHSFVYEILNNNAVISIGTNTNGNIDFSAEFYSYENEMTAQSMGHTYKKLLCACFDLAVIKNYMNFSFYRFIYHDGCLESLDPRKQKKYLDLIRRIAKDSNIQYILTCLSSDVPNEEKYLVKESEISVNLSDKEDNSGRLFGFSF